MININYSSTYSFQKPISDEKYNIGVFNTNMDLVDSVLNRVEKKNKNQDESITKAQADIDNEVSRATEKEKELEQDLQDEVIRASSAENEISNDLSLEIDRAVNSEESIRTDLSALISALTERLNTLADSDDTTLDQLSEIVAYIKNNKDLIDGITTAIPTKTSQLTNDSGYITSVDTNSDVTGVKGNAESTYRKGNVNLTAANIGALPDAVVPISKGGTGKVKGDAAINDLSRYIGNYVNDDLKDTDIFASSSPNIGSGTYLVKRPMSVLWTYIKNKINATNSGIKTPAATLADKATAMNTYRFIDGVKYDGTDNVIHFYRSSATFNSSSLSYEFVITDSKLNVFNGTRIYFQPTETTDYAKFLLVINGISYKVVNGSGARLHDYMLLKSYKVYEFIYSSFHSCFVPVNHDFENNLAEYFYGYTGTTAETHSFTTRKNQSTDPIPNGAYLIVGKGRTVNNTYDDYFTVHMAFSGKGNNNGSKLVPLGTNGSTARYVVSVSTDGFGMSSIALQVKANVYYEIKIFHLTDLTQPA